MPIKPIRTEKVKLDGNTELPVPFFSLNDVPECFCARYARLSSEFLFGKRFPASDSWEIRLKPGVISRRTNNQNFKFFSNNGKVSPGSIIGIYNPRSSYNNKNRPYTHISLYLGKQRGKDVFLEQFVDETRMMTIRDYELEMLQIKEILSLR